MSIHRTCVISRRCRSCGASLLRLVRLHDIEVGFGCLHRQRSCGNVPVHSVFKGMNIIAVLLLFNYIDRSWAMGVEDFFFCFLLRIPTPLKVSPLSSSKKSFKKVWFSMYSRSPI
jgi:hypothetical protein